MFWKSLKFELILVLFIKVYLLKYTMFWFELVVLAWLKWKDSKSWDFLDKVQIFLSPETGLVIFCFIVAFSFKSISSNKLETLPYFPSQDGEMTAWSELYSSQELAQEWFY